MISLKLLEKKPIITDPKTGEEKIDLAYPIVSRRSIFKIERYYNVTENDEMRPDLISYMYNGDEGEFGLILKLNAISNPYSIKKDDLLIIPTYESSINAYNSISQTADTAVKPKSYRRELQEKISKVSPERLEYLNARNISDVARSTTGATSNVNLPPNVLGQDQEGSRVIDGKLVFGPDVGQCRGTVRRPLSEAQLRARLIEKKIFKGV
jgi:hypothetical protein